MTCGVKCGVGIWLGRVVFLFLGGNVVFLRREWDKILSQPTNRDHFCSCCSPQFLSRHRHLRKPFRVIKEYVHEPRQSKPSDFLIEHTDPAFFGDHADCCRAFRRTRYHAPRADWTRMGCVVWANPRLTSWWFPFVYMMSLSRTFRFLSTPTPTSPQLARILPKTARLPILTKIILQYGCGRTPTSHQGNISLHQQARRYTSKSSFPGTQFTDTNQMPSTKH